jgi:hypothetical protein
MNCLVSLAGACLLLRMMLCTCGFRARQWQLFCCFAVCGGRALARRPMATPNDPKPNQCDGERQDNILQREPVSTPVVRSVEDAARWVEHGFASLKHDISKGNANILTFMRRSLIVLTVSTCFSGIGAPEVALDCISKAFDHFLPTDGPYGLAGLSGLRHDLLWAFEVDKQKTSELMMLNPGPTHLGGDVKGLIKEL